MSSVELNTAALESLLRGHSGPVAAYLGRIGLAVESEAKRNASGQWHGYWTGHGYGRDPNPGSDEGPGMREGRLRNSITHEVRAGPTGDLEVRIGTNVEYAAFLEFGTTFMPGGYPFLRTAMGVARGVR